MSGAPFPKTVDPMKMVEQRVDLQGKIAVAQLLRFRECLLNDGGEVEIALRFARDETGNRTVSGTLRTDVTLQCQRCLQPLKWVIDTRLNMGIVFSEEAARNLPGNYDPLLLSTSELEMWPMVEEELILNIPIAAKHPDNACHVKCTYGEVVEPDDPGDLNPFKVLERLKTDR